MQYKLQVRNFIFVVLSLALLVGLASSVAAEALDFVLDRTSRGCASFPFIVNYYYLCV